MKIERTYNEEAANDVASLLDRVRANTIAL